MQNTQAPNSLIKAEQSQDDRSVLLTLTSSEDNLHAAPSDKPLFSESITRDCFKPSYLRDNHLIERELKGRGIVYFFNWSERLLALRSYYRGGAVAKISESSFIYTGLKNTRCYQELSVLAYLNQKNINVPLPVAAIVKRKGPFYCAAIITEVIENAIELDALLQQQTVSEDVWQSIGQEIRRMHNAQVCHYDLNVKNILLQNNKVYLIDFDKCEIKQGDDWKQANLKRLERSLNKQQGLQTQYHYHNENFAVLLKAYKDA